MDKKVKEIIDKFAKKKEMAENKEGRKRKMNDDSAGDASMKNPRFN